MTDFDKQSDRAALRESMTEGEWSRLKEAEPGGGGGPNSKYFSGSKKFHLLGTNLFGEEVKADATGKIRERFEFPPFTVLNAQKGEWQARKNAWLACGITSEIGRGENLLKMSDTVLEPDPEKRAVMQASRGDARTFGSGAPGDLASDFKRRESASLNGGLVLGTTTDPYRREGEEVEGAGGSGTSIFDPVLTEMCYRWFCVPGGQIVDPFAGGSVRGIVAGLLGFKYHGIDLRPEQIAANEAQRQLICPDAPINWVVGDSNLMLPHAPDADMIFSCPPYGDLEVYSDDPNDLSTMTWNGFVKLYMSIIKRSVERMKPNSFAIFVVGEYRDKQTGFYRGFVPLTCAAFMAAGAPLYNEAILITAVGSLPIRVTKQFETTRKLGKTHQNVLCFVKGDPKIAAERIRNGTIDNPPPIIVRPTTPSPSDPLPLMPVSENGPATAGNSLLGQAPAGTVPLGQAPLGPAPEALKIGPFPAQESIRPAPSGSAALAFGLAQREVKTPTVQVPAGSTIADFLGMAPMRSMPDWKPQEPPSLDGITDIVLNFETNGLNWAGGDLPIGVTVGTLDGRLRRFLPWGFRGNNLDEAAVKRWAERELRGKKIHNANTRFDVHMAREWGIDLEAQGNGVSDAMHWAALLDDHRKKFALDVLAKDWLGGIDVPRMDERNMAGYDAAEVASRAEYQVKLVAQLRERMWPELTAQDLQEVRQLEDEVIYPVVEMEKNGSLLDMELVEQYHAECVARHGALIVEISKEAGFGFEHTPTGWAKLFEHCGFPPSDEGYAEDITGSVDHPLIKKAAYAKQIAQLDSKTFAAYRKNVDSKGVLRYDINQLRGDEGGTVSGRFSIGYVQQVPNAGNHKLVFGDDLYPRRVFIPDRDWIGDTGYVPQYLEADASQIEYRLFAHFAENPEVLEAYRQNPNLSFHKMTQGMLERYKPDMLYEHTKNFNFAAMYGAKMVKLAIMMRFITEKEGAEIREAKRWNDPRLSLIKEIEAAYTKVMPEKDLLLDKASYLAKPRCDDYCKKNDRWHRELPHRGFVKTICGRRSRFPDGYKTYIALNRVLQGSASDIMKRKLVELHRERKYTGLLMRLTVHDAVGGDARMPETLERVSELLNIQSFPLKVSILWACGQGKNWAECKA